MDYSTRSLQPNYLAWLPDRDQLPINFLYYILDSEGDEDSEEVEYLGSSDFSLSFK